MILLKFNWAPDEVLLRIGSFGIHYYSLMFIIAFAVGYYILKRFYKNEGVSEDYLEPLFVYTVLGTLIGARLGEVFFYNWDYFQDHLVEILLPVKEVADGSMFFGLIKGWEFSGYRGLASHGAAIGIITAMILYRRKYKYKSVLWILDRIVIPVSFGGIFIRIGNFFNSEIVGKYTGSSFGVVFENRGEILPRHPAQLYESLGYVIVFLVLRHLYWNTQRKDQTGFLFGSFLVLLFSVRFVVEFVKESQGGFESALGVFSTGQWLSIPLIIAGFIFAYRARKTA
ncbi:MAG: prolipoprotein diacylglyceryl transferase [Flavobacteriaceae bacterium]